MIVRVVDDSLVGQAYKLDVQFHLEIPGSFLGQLPPVGWPLHNGEARDGRVKLIVMIS